jgi:hypothetical protein
MPEETEEFESVVSPSLGYAYKIAESFRAQFSLSDRSSQPRGSLASAFGVSEAQVNIVYSTSGAIAAAFIGFNSFAPRVLAFGARTLPPSLVSVGEGSFAFALIRLGSLRRADAFAAILPPLLASERAAAPLGRIEKTDIYDSLRVLSALIHIGLWSRLAPSARLASVETLLVGSLAYKLCGEQSGGEDEGGGGDNPPIPSAAAAAMQLTRGDREAIREIVASVLAGKGKR